MESSKTDGASRVSVSPTRQKDQRKERKQSSGRPKDRRDLPLRPPLELKMVVERSAEEDPLFPQLVRCDLKDHGNSLQGQHSPRNQEEDFLLEKHRGKPQGASPRERASVSHEDLR